MPGSGCVAGAAARVEFDLGSSVDDSPMTTYFKSSFAKSMALSAEHQSKSLDCSTLNAVLRARVLPEFAALAEVRAPLRGFQDLGAEDTAQVRRDSSIPRGGPGGLDDVNPSTVQEDGSRSDAATKELARLRKELRSLQEENRRLQAGGGQAQTDTADMVDTVLLQNQVDTLQWQLRQTENSRHMYRAVMEQVVRFLERAHRNLKLAAGSPRPKTPNGRVPRSRSVHTVDVCPGRASPRDSLPDFQRAKSITQIEDSQSYSAFRDFTWRRPRPSQTDLEEVPPEKLSQEAFRLLRTVQSLLNTREPDLAHRLSGSGSGSGDSEPRSERSSVVSLDQTDDTISMDRVGKDSSQSTLVADVSGALRRRLNIRNSQVVSCASFNRLRDSAAESKSNSSSSTTEDGDYDAVLLSGLESAFAGCNGSSSSTNRLEEARQALRKEENLLGVGLHGHRKPPPPPTPQPSLSSAEDESGFSSMGSFQEVGLPLMSSTQSDWHSASPSPSTRSHGSFHEVGLPAVPQARHHHGKPPVPVPIHRRWSSNPVEALTRSAYKGAEALRVLWV